MKFRELSPLLDIMKHLFFILLMTTIVLIIVLATRKTENKPKIRLVFDHPPDVMAPVLFPNGSHCGFIDIYGNAMIEADVEILRQFSEGLAAVKDDGKWGYMDKYARIIIRPEYEDVGPFMSGIALVDSGKTGKKLIDKTGKVIRSFSPNTKVKRYRNGFLRVKDGDDSPCLLFDAELNEIELIDADKILSYSEGIFIIKGMDGNFSYLDENGSALLTVPSNWKLARFSMGYGRVADADGYYYLVDKSGSTVLDGRALGLKGYIFGTISEEMVDFSILDGNYYRSGYMNLAGEVVVEPNLFSALPFHNGVAWVKTYDKARSEQTRDKRVGFVVIDKTGEIVSPENFDRPTDVYDCSDYMLVCYHDGNQTMRAGVADSLGNVLIPPIFSEPFNFSYNRAFVRYKSDYDSIIDKSGKFVASNVGIGLAQFENINDTGWYHDVDEYKED